MFRIIRKLLLTFPLSLIVLFCLVCFENSNAQDIHFSQYLLAPSNLNPSLTGEFDGDYRIIGNYRNQWNSITVPYRTFGFAGDVSNFAHIKNFGAGLSIFNDLSGDSEFSTTVFQIAGAYSYPLTKDSSQKVHFGLQPSFVRQALDFSKLYFDAQYNEQIAQFDPTLPNRETSGITGANWLTISAGIRWSYKKNNRNMIDFGLAGFNLTNPANSLYNSDDNENGLARRFNFHGNYQFKAFEKMDLIPGFLYSWQGKSQNFVTGLSARYLFNGYTAFHFGLWYRNKDAGFASLGMTYQSLYLGMSYDINTSELREVSNGKGAFELSLVYVFRKFKPSDGKYMSCPNYL